MSKKIEIGKLISQKEGYKAFVPNKFPPKEKIVFSDEINTKKDRAIQLLGKLDGISRLLEDKDFFLFMYTRKDAASSSQIEGTNATMVDAIEAEANISSDLPDDVDDILHYIKALNYGIKRINEIPLSLRFVRELHKELMNKARSTHFADPGEFRKTQNWIGGTRPDNARFVPPPVFDMKNALSDLENFMHSKNELSPIVKIGLAHAQFEAIHPFLDGNGRTGRMLITFYFSKEKLLEKPILFLSTYFKKHQQVYYEKLDKYTQGDVEGWLEFFLDAVEEISQEAIGTVDEITKLQKQDMLKIQSLGKRASESAVLVLPMLYKMPIVNVAKIKEWTGFTRAGAQKVVDRFVEMGILYDRNPKENYDKSYIYKDYVNIFQSE